jgi:hypothetical protein
MIDYKVLKSQLSQIEKNLKGLVSQLLYTESTDTALFLKLEERVRKEYEKAVVIFRKWAGNTMPAEYRSDLIREMTSIKNIATGLSQSEIDRIRKNLLSIKNINPRTSKILDNVTTSFITAATKGNEILLRMIRQTQQLLISEKNVNKMIEEGFQDSGSIYKSIRNLRKAIEAKIKDSDYMQIINKNGDVMNFEIKYYAELVARTKLHEQSTMAALDAMNSLGLDLIQISSHNTETLYDAQFEGKIYSMSGQDPDFPAVIDLPPFHPNCKHVATATSREQLGIKGPELFGEYVKFSNGEAERPPNKPAFTPLSRRDFGKQNLDEQMNNRKDYASGNS